MSWGWSDKVQDMEGGESRLRCLKGRTISRGWRGEKGREVAKVAVKGGVYNVPSCTERYLFGVSYHQNGSSTCLLLILEQKIQRLSNRSGLQGEASCRKSTVLLGR